MQPSLSFASPSSRIAVESFCGVFEIVLITTGLFEIAFMPERV